MPLDNNWKDKTCEKCDYRVDEKCRRFPPYADDYSEIFPTVFYETYPKGKEYTRACAEYKELL
jgi:hypothetical protein